MISLIGFNDWIDETISEGFSVDDIKAALCDGQLLECISYRVHVDEESVNLGYDYLQAMQNAGGAA
jgi:hypothetical protein